MPLLPTLLLPLPFYLPPAGSAGAGYAEVVFNDSTYCSISERAALSKGDRWAPDL